MIRIATTNEEQILYLQGCRRVLIDMIWEVSQEFARISANEKTLEVSLAFHRILNSGLCSLLVTEQREKELLDKVREDLKEADDRLRKVGSRQVGENSIGEPIYDPYPVVFTNTKEKST